MGKLWSDKAIFWSVVGVLAIAFGLRVWALNWGLPYLYDHDETQLVVRIQHIFKTGDLNPHQFAYGSLFFYINALAYVPYFLAGWATGKFHSPLDIAYPDRIVMAVGVTTMPSTYLLGRSVSLLFGVGCVYMVFLIGKRVSANPAVGLVAALMMAVSPTCVQYSRSITPNIMVVFFILLAVWGAIRIYYENTTRAYVLAGIAVGLVVSTKYNGLIVLGVVVLAALLRDGFWPAIKNGRLYMAVGLCALTFILTSPFALLDSQTFISSINSEALHYSTGHLGMEGDTAQWYVSFLWTQEGPVSLLGFIGVVYAIARRSKPLILVAAFPVAYALFISEFTVRNDRTIMPLLPYLFILAAVLVVGAVQWVMARGLKSRVALAAGGLAVMLLSIAPVNTTAAAAVQAISPDSRLTGVEWIKENIPPGAKVGIETGAPYLDAQVYSVKPELSIIAHTPDWYVQQRYDYLIFADGMFERFYREPDLYSQEIAQYDAFFNRFQLVKELDDGGYAVRIYAVATN